MIIATVVTVVACGIAVWTVAGRSPQAAAGPDAAIAARTGAAATASPARSSAPRPSPAPPSPSPMITVTGAPGGVKAKGAVLADAATG
jgi:hypothetical protein